jgi:hypothetical protein
MTKKLYTGIAAALALVGALQPAAADSVTVERVEAHDIDELDLRVCFPTRVLVRGDGDTDLDFAIVGSDGLMHVDADGTDWTTTTLRPGRYGCRHYKLLVENTGNVYNRYYVRLIEL